MNKVLALSFFLILILTGSSYAKNSSNTSSHNESISNIGTVVVAATRYPESLDTVASTLTVITEEDIEDKDAVSMDEVLIDVPGLDISSLGSPGQDLDIRMRGSNRNEVLVYIDGVKLNNPANDRTQLGLLPLNSVERIEILHGSQSVLYGSNAIGGVIQIFTKKAQKKGYQAKIDFSGGNLETFRENISTTGKNNYLDYSLNYTRIDQKGRFARDRFGENALSGNINFLIGDSATISLLGNYWQSSQQLPTEFLFVPGALAAADADPTTAYIYLDNDVNRAIKRHYTANKINYTQDYTDWWCAMAFYSFGYFNDREENSNQNDTAQTTQLGTALTPNSVLNKIKSYRHEVTIQQKFTPIDSDYANNVLLLGFDFEYEDVKISGEYYPGDTPIPPGSVGPLPPNSPFPSNGQPGNRKNYAVYLQNNLALNSQFVISSGARLDLGNTFSAEVSPRIATSYLFKKIGTKIKGSYSKGFHTPTVVDYYLAKTWGLNDNLKAETSHSFELGVEQNLFDNKLSIESVFFYISFKDLILNYQNIGKSTSWGFENNIKIYPFPELLIKGNYTYTNATDNSGGETPLPNRAKHRGNLSVTYKPLKRLTTHLDFNIVGKRYEQFALVNTSGIPISGSFANAASLGNRVINRYFNLDLAFWYDFFKKSPKKHFQQLRLHSKIRNITNSKHEDRYGFPSSGITFLSGLTATF